MDKPKHSQDANIYIERAIEMMKESQKRESLIADYNGIVSLLSYAKESHTYYVSLLTDLFEKLLLMVERYDFDKKAVITDVMNRLIDFKKSISENG